MKRLGLVSRLAIYITGVVAVIFSAAMYLVYVNSKDSIFAIELENEQTDLSHTAEMLDLLVEEGMPYDELERHAENPWNDGSYRNAYDLVPADSVEIVARRMKRENPNVIILRAPLRCTVKRVQSAECRVQSGSAQPDSALCTLHSALHKPFRAVLLEKYSGKDYIAAVHKAMSHTIGLSFIIMILLGVAISLAVKYILRPEMERRARIDAELEIAKNLQNKMLPAFDGKSVEPENVQVMGWMKPAKEIGGDYYYFLPLGDYLHFIIADVAGKGIPAAMFLVRLSELYLLDLTMHSEREPDKIANELSNRLCTGNAAYMFATAVIGKLNTRTGLLELCSAGHEPPLIITEDGSAEFMKIDNDVPIGLVQDYEYRVHKAYLKGNSHLLFYTDGISEAENEKREQFSRKRLAEIMRGQGGCAPEQVIKHIIKNIRHFTGSQEQSDDITLLDIKLSDISDHQAMRLDLTNDINELDKILRMADELQLPGNVTLALEEAFVNVVNYSRATAVTVEVDKQADSITVTVTDDGDAFDPTAYQPPADSGLTDQNGFVRVGGKGIHLITTLIPTVAYRRADGKNILTLKA